MEEYVTVAGIGHRDIGDHDKCYRATCSLLLELKRRYTDKALRIVSPLAEGADILIVKAGVSLGLSYSVLLPMPVRLYEADFTDAASLAEFHHLLAGAKEVRTVDYYAHNTLELVSRPGIHRDYQYRACGYKLARDCEQMIALFDGDSSTIKLGGTADVIAYRQALRRPLKMLQCERMTLK